MVSPYGAFPGRELSNQKEKSALRRYGGRDALPPKARPRERRAKSTKLLACAKLAAGNRGLLVMIHRTLALAVALAAVAMPQVSQAEPNAALREESCPQRSQFLDASCW